MKIVAFTGGGSGGHIFPGIAVAEEILKHEGYGVFWIGSNKGMDREIVESAGLEFVGVPAGKLRRYFSFKTFFDFFRIIGGFFSSYRILKKRSPVLLFSKGGFVSVPPCIAARFLKIPVITHECDVTLGLANKINSLFAKKLLLSFSRTYDFLSVKNKAKAIVTGNPVRKIFYSADKTRGLEFIGKFYDISENKLPVVLVTGGSMGAKTLNELIESILPEILDYCVLVHQRGKGNLSPVSYPGYVQLEFITTQMADLLAAADIVISRAGSNSVWETVTLGKPVILLPLEGSGTRGDQVDNSLYIQESGCGIMLSHYAKDEKFYPTSENLKRILLDLLGNPEKLKKMSENAGRIIPENPAARIASVILENEK